MSRWIAGSCVVVLVGAGIAIVQVRGTAGDSWLAILWAAWIVTVVWALTRPSFSLLYAAIMVAMLTSMAGLLGATALVCRRRSPVLEVAPVAVPSERIRPGKTRRSVVKP